MVILHKLYVGLKDKDTKKQEISNLKAKNIIKDLCKTLEIDCTLLRAHGIYTHATGEQIEENTIVIEILEFDTQLELRLLIKILKEFLNQESIGYYQIKLDKCELL